jgi:uncharacterized protein
VLQATLAFVERELTAPNGGFYSALDADSEGEEGKFYVWSDKDLDAELTDKDEAKLIKTVYALNEAPNFESKYHILTLPRTLANRAGDLGITEEQLDAKLQVPRQRLFAARARRPRPFLDTKILTAWNGEMIAGAAIAGAALDDKKAIGMAEKAADFVLNNLRTKDGRLLRTYGAAPGQKPEARINAYLDDYAFLTHGLLCLHDATGDKRWLQEAKAQRRRLFLYRQRPGEVVRPGKGPVRRCPAVRQQHCRPQSGSTVGENGRRSLQGPGGEDVQGHGRDDEIPTNSIGGHARRPGVLSGSAEER